MDLALGIDQTTGELAQGLTRLLLPQVGLGIRLLEAAFLDQPDGARNGGLTGLVARAAPGAGSRPWTAAMLETGRSCNGKT